MKRALNFLSLSRHSTFADSTDHPVANVVPHPSPADLASPMWRDQENRSRDDDGHQQQMVRREKDGHFLQKWERRPGEQIAPQQTLEKVRHDASTLKWIFTFWRLLLVVRRAEEARESSKEFLESPADLLEQSLRQQDSLKSHIELLAKDASAAMNFASQARRRERRAKEQRYEIIEENRSLKAQLQQVSTSLDASLSAFTKTVESSLESSIPKFDEAEWKKTMLEEYERAFTAGRSQALNSSTSSPPRSTPHKPSISELHCTPSQSRQLQESNSPWLNVSGSRSWRPHDRSAPPSSLSHASPIEFEATLTRERPSRNEEDNRIYAIEFQLLEVLKTHEKIRRELGTRKELHSWAAKERALSERVCALQREVERRKEAETEANRQLARAMDRLTAAEARAEDLEAVALQHGQDEEARKWMQEQVQRQHDAVMKLGAELTKGKERVTRSERRLAAELEKERARGRGLEERLRAVEAAGERERALERALGEAEERAAEREREVTELRAAIGKGKAQQREVGCDAWTPLKLGLSRVWAEDADAGGQGDGAERSEGDSEGGGSGGRFSGYDFDVTSGAEPEARLDDFQLEVASGRLAEAPGRDRTRDDLGAVGRLQPVVAMSRRGGPQAGGDSRGRGTVMSRRGQGELWAGPGAQAGAGAGTGEGEMWTQGVDRSGGGGSRGDTGWTAGERADEGDLGWRGDDEGLGEGGWEERAARNAFLEWLAGGSGGEGEGAEERGREVRDGDHRGARTLQGALGAFST